MGRPFIANEPIDFNLSHSGDLALIALNTGGGRIGADIERCKEVSDLMRLAETVLTRKELATLSPEDANKPQSLLPLLDA